MLLVSLPDKLPEKEFLKLTRFVQPMEVLVEEDFLNPVNRLPLEKVEIWITYGSDITEKALNRMPSLKWIQVFQSGTEKVPIEELRKRNVMLTNIKGIHGIPMTEHVISTMLYFTKNIQKYNTNKAKRVWDRTGYDEELYGKTVSIFGAGTVGVAIAERCRDFGMHVIGINTNGIQKPPFDEMYSMNNKEMVLKESDYIILLLPATPATHHCISKNELSLMKKSAYLINLGRGPLINNEDLITSLENGDISGAALDVFDEEPLPKDNPLWGAPNLLLTPHMAARTKNYYERAMDKFLLNFSAFQKNEQPPYYIDFDRGF
ncbi:D-2-hydroxyacid dehydrogenase [Niallia sp. Krafla_26]|uniref:D-2-hydroxyacid dehydrogenase n=1 Tax=Niallia sp. Krafla_26 TaxID=3064703 RepID=UPI003D170C9E